MAQRITHWIAVIMTESKNSGTELREEIIPISSALVRPHLELPVTCRVRARADPPHQPVAGQPGVSLQQLLSQESGASLGREQDVISGPTALSGNLWPQTPGDAGPELQQPSFQEGGYCQALGICVQFCTCLPV